MTPGLHPTLWRTCRAVANHTRLRLLVALAQHQPQSVSGLAAELNLPLPVASLFLRLLESRSLLTAERVRRRVEYRFATTGSTAAFAEFVQTLQATLRRNPKQAAEVFRWATGLRTQPGSPFTGDCSRRPRPWQNLPPTWAFRGEPRPATWQNFSGGDSSPHRRRCGRCGPRSALWRELWPPWLLINAAGVGHTL